MNLLSVSFLLVTMTVSSVVFVLASGNEGTEDVPVSDPSDCTWTVKQIPRIDAAEIPTVQDFWNTYSEIPVIITGIANAFIDDETDYFAFMKEKCPDGRMPIWEKAEKRGRKWADLREIGTVSIAEMIDYVLDTDDEDEEDDDDPEDLLYGFDMVVSEECPEIFDKVTIPRYFNECLHRSKYSPDEFLWPSLMMGPRGSSSAIHVDTDGLPFWMTLLQGRKHWRVLPYKANYHLTSETPMEDFSPPAYGDEFRGNVLEEYMAGRGWRYDAFEPDFNRFPRLCEAEMHEAILEAGEIIFIPNSALHGVVNIEHTIAMSANLMSPYDKAQRRWLETVCASPDVEEYDQTVCDAYVQRYDHRAWNAGPQREVTFEEYSNEDFFMQSFDPASEVQEF